MEITEFETDPVLMNLMNEHMGWHGVQEANDMGFPKRKIPKGLSGSGLEFLQFHSYFLEQFSKWNKSNGGKYTSYIQPWIKLPDEITGYPDFTDSHYDVQYDWITDAPRRDGDVSVRPFNSSDELGIYIEADIHGFLHTVCAIVFKELLVQPVVTSPRSTYFYNLHGWINYWWNYWYGPQTLKRNLRLIYFVVSLIPIPGWLKRIFIGPR